LRMSSLSPTFSSLQLPSSAIQDVQVFKQPAFTALRLFL